MTERQPADVVVIGGSHVEALRWATRRGYRRPLFPRSVADLDGLAEDVPVYASESLWEHARAESLADWLRARLQAAQPRYVPFSEVARERGSAVN